MPNEQDWSWYPNASGSSLDTLPAGRSLPSFPHLDSGPNPSLPSGGGFGSNVNWGNVAGLGAGVLGSLFAGGSGDNGQFGQAITEVQKNARDLGATGKGITAQGLQALGPAQKYFADLLSGNPADVMSATAPERRRVIDQYDTARRSAGQFTPRGGGQASSQQEARSREAGDLATLGADARRGAAGAASQLGLSELNAGVSAEEQATSQLASVLEPLFQQQQSNQKNMLSTVTGIAELAATLFL